MFDILEELDVVWEKDLIFKYDVMACLCMCNSISMSVEEVEVVLDEGVLYVVCLKVLDNEIIFFEDIVWGEVVFDSFELDDKVLFKVDGMFIYYMVNVVDDCLMEIIYVVRGEEWLLSIVYYVLFYWSLGWE